MNLVFIYTTRRVALDAGEYLGRYIASQGYTIENFAKSINSRPEVIENAVHLTGSYDPKQLGYLYLKIFSKTKHKRFNEIYMEMIKCK